jgi:hypothetical protein
MNHDLVRMYTNNTVRIFWRILSAVRRAVLNRSGRLGLSQGDVFPLNECQQGKNEHG